MICTYDTMYEYDDCLVVLIILNTVPSIVDFISYVYFVVMCFDYKDKIYFKETYFGSSYTELKK